MIKKFTGILLLSVFVFNAKAQLPVIQAGSKLVDIIDGDHFKKGYWYIMPEKKPDTYYAEIPRKPHRVMFRTDRDSIAFDTKYDSTYDFIILLNGRDSCYTRIVAHERNLMTYSRPLTAAGPDTIPFTIGNNNKIYVDLRINHSAPLRFQFDLGSGGTLLKKKSVKKVPIVFDDSITLINNQGTNKVPSSQHNILEIGPLQWQEITVVVADNMTWREDGIIGNGLFQNKIVEINYDKLLLVLHDSLPAIDNSYERHRVILDGFVPYFQAELRTDEGTFNEWFLFDTGSSGSITVSDALNDQWQLHKKTKQLFNFPNQRIALLPELGIGNQAFKDVILGIRKTASRPHETGFVGNALLKRFNVILDNTGGYIYLKPNSLLNTPYDRTQVWVSRWYKPVLALILVGLACILIKKVIGRKKTG